MVEEETNEASESKGKDPKDMGWHEWADYKVTKLDYIDMNILETGGFLFGLPVGAYYHVQLMPYWWAFIVLALVIYLRPLKRMFG